MGNVECLSVFVNELVNVLSNGVLLAVIMCLNLLCGSMLVYLKTCIAV